MSYELSGRPQFDSRDEFIRLERQAALDKVEKPRCGDYVIFADNVVRRVSYVWDWGAPDEMSIQTSDGGSFYLGDGYVSFSGTLYSGVPYESLSLTEEKRPGSVWFFHHDFAQAHNGVHCEVSFRVYKCSLRSES